MRTVLCISLILGPFSATGCVKPALGSSPDLWTQSYPVRVSIEESEQQIFGSGWLPDSLLVSRERRGLGPLTCTGPDCAVTRLGAQTRLQSLLLSEPSDGGPWQAYTVSCSDKGPCEIGSSAIELSQEVSVRLGHTLSSFGEGESRPDLYGLQLTGTNQRITVLRDPDTATLIMFMSRLQGVQRQMKGCLSRQPGLLVREVQSQSYAIQVEFFLPMPDLRYEQQARAIIQVVLNYSPDTFASALQTGADELQLLVEVAATNHIVHKNTGALLRTPTANNSADFTKFQREIERCKDELGS